MDFLIIIPAHNEEAFLGKTLQSLMEQTLLPKKIIIVNDHSTDGTQTIIDSFTSKFDFIHSLSVSSDENHSPGSKVINAFNNGLEAVDSHFDVICKFDADLIFPTNYLERVSEIFVQNPNCGMAGGFCTIEKNGNWVLENLTGKDHIRGALKAYRKECFKDINGLKNSMGWDTVDELLAKYHGWEIRTDETLKVKHLKPTGQAYGKSARFKQGEAFYKMRYGFLLTAIAAGKLALRKNSVSFFVDSMQGFLKSMRSKIPFIVSEKEGQFIRKLRWSGIKKKIFVSK